MYGAGTEVITADQKDDFPVWNLTVEKPVDQLQILLMVYVLWVRVVGACQCLHPVEVALQPCQPANCWLRIP